MSNHPVSEDQLMAHAFGDLGAEGDPAFASHLAGCGECAAVLARFDLVRATVCTDATLVPSNAALTRVLGLMAGRQQAAFERPSAFASLKRLVASLVFDGRAAPAMAGLRGATTAYVLRYSLDGLDVDLEIEPIAGDEHGRWQVTGQIDGPEPAGALALAFAESGSRRPAGDVRTDEDGMFFAELAAGSYDLLIQLADSLVVVPDVEVG